MSAQECKKCGADLNTNSGWKHFPDADFELNDGMLYQDLYVDYCKFCGEVFNIEWR